MARKPINAAGIGAGLLALVAAAWTAPAGTSELPRREIVDMAIPQPLTAAPGDVARGQRLALDRSKGNCVTCHEMPVSADFQGNLGPPLAGVADRYTPGELRLRLVDSKQINPDSNMPSYHRVEGLNGVRRAFAGQPILSAQEVEDVLAYLLTLR